MAKAKITTIDIDGKEWSAEGDFIFGAVGKYLEGPKNPPFVEVDFSKLTKPQMLYIIATILVVAGQTDPQVTQTAIGLALEELGWVKK